MDPRANGVACANRDCPYNDNRHEQHCKATTRNGGPWVVGCNQYSPDPIDLAVALNSPARPVVTETLATDATAGSRA